MSTKQQRDFRMFQTRTPLTILSAHDARLRVLAESLGLEQDGFPLLSLDHYGFESLATSDVKEIKTRQQVAKWILDNPKVARRFTEEFDTENLPETLPQNGDQFFGYYSALGNRETRFWWIADFFQNEIACNPDIPNRLKAVATELEKKTARMIREEQRVADKFLGMLRTMSPIMGALTFNIDTYGVKDLVNLKGMDDKKEHKNIVADHCFGARLYNTALYEERVADAPVWKVGQRMAKGAQKRRIRSAIDSARITSTPFVVMRDIAEYLNRTLVMDSPLNTIRDGIRSIQITIVYWFTGEGLNIRIANWHIEPKKGVGDNKQEFESIKFGVAEDSDRVKTVLEKMRSCIVLDHESDSCLRMSRWLDSQIDPKTIPAERTLAEFCLPNVKTAWHQLKDEFNPVLEWQESLMSAFRDLYFFARAVRSIAESGLEYCIPEITAKGRKSFRADRMYPVRLRNRCKVHPFDGLSLNGQILDVTGRNNSGKSCLLEEVQDIVIKGQCGLPVTAREATFTAKQNLLLSFLERSSQDSTFVSKLRKDQRIIDAIKQMDDAQRVATLVLIDECGSATTPGGVMPVIQPYASFLADSGVSVILSTQLPEFSEFIRDELGGRCIIITPEYHVVNGIGQGEAEAVAREAGFFTTLGLQKAGA